MPKSSFAVFPFLAASAPVRVGKLEFRSITDTVSLSKEDADHVRVIADMLYLRDDEKPDQSSYAAIPYVDIANPNEGIEHLRAVQDLVAYACSEPDPRRGEPFVEIEHASLVLFSPGLVITSLVTPKSRSPHGGNGPHSPHDLPLQIDGYAGLYGLRLPFWVAQGSRLYGTIPHQTSGGYLDLAHVLHFGRNQELHQLSRAIGMPTTENLRRIMTAIRWCNAANSVHNGDEASVVFLSIAFETLLMLSETEQKSQALSASIKLLLGPVRRLESWTKQFYSARSAIIHEGDAVSLDFIATDDWKPKSNGPRYQSLLSFGRRVFRLCARTLLAGTDFVERAGLMDSLVTNQERFQTIIQILDDSSDNPATRLSRIAPIVAMASTFQFEREPDLRIDTLLGAARRLATAILQLGAGLMHPYQATLNAMATAKKSHDHFAELSALEAIGNRLPELRELLVNHESAVDALRLFEVVWRYTFMHYYWLEKEHRSDGQPKST